MGLVLRNQDYAYWGALQLGLWLIDILESTDKNTKFMREPKTIVNVLKFFLRSKNDLLCFLCTKGNVGIRMMPVHNKKGKVIAYTPLNSIFGSAIKIPEVAEMISPQEYKYRDTAKILGDALKRACDTISILTGRDSNDVFNSLIKEDNIDIPEAFGNAPKDLPQNDRKTKVVVDNMSNEKYQKAKAVLKKASDDTKAELRARKTGCSVDIGFKVLKLEDCDE